jgi:hypothetical protein
MIDNRQVWRVPRTVFCLESCIFDRVNKKEPNLYGMLQQELPAATQR